MVVYAVIRCYTLLDAALRCYTVLYAAMRCYPPLDAALLDAVPAESVTQLADRLERQHSTVPSGDIPASSDDEADSATHLRALFELEARRALAMDSQLTHVDSAVAELQGAMDTYRQSTQTTRRPKRRADS